MEKAKHFLSAVSDDESLAKQLNGAASRQAFLSIAERHGFSLTAEDIDTINKIADAHEKQQAGESLSEEELELVSGGGVSEHGSDPNEHLRLRTVLRIP